MTITGYLDGRMNWQVIVDAGMGRPKPLPLCLEYVNHSPDGFAWGYEGSGPAQLAFAILFANFGEDVARACYQDFKSQVIARLDGDKPFAMVIDASATGWQRPETAGYDWRQAVEVTQ